jgi:predicted HTH domain antitoxin
MQVTLNLPDDISSALAELGQDVSRYALEAIAVEGYRRGLLSEAQVRRLLGLETRFDVHAVLKAHNVALRYSAADIQDELAAHGRLGVVVPMAEPTVLPQTHG